MFSFIQFWHYSTKCSQTSRNSDPLSTTTIWVLIRALKFYSTSLKKPPATLSVFLGGGGALSSLYVFRVLNYHLISNFFIHSNKKYLTVVKMFIFLALISRYLFIQFHIFLISSIRQNILIFPDIWSIMNSYGKFKSFFMTPSALKLIDGKNVGWYSQNFLRKFLKISVTLGLNIFRFLRLKVVFQSKYHKRLILLSLYVVNTYF